MFTVTGERDIAANFAGPLRCHRRANSTQSFCFPPFCSYHAKTGLRAMFFHCHREGVTLLRHSPGLDVLPTSPATFLTAGATSSHL